MPLFRKGSKGQYQLVADIFALKRLKEKIKQITNKTIPMTFDERITKLNQVLKGWMHYFKYANMRAKLRTIDVWIRRRLRGPNEQWWGRRTPVVSAGAAYSIIIFLFLFL